MCLISDILLSLILSFLVCDDVIYLSSSVALSRFRNIFY